MSKDYQVIRVRDYTGIGSGWVGRKALPAEKEAYVRQLERSNDPEMCGRLIAQWIKEGKWEVCLFFPRGAEAPEVMAMAKTRLVEVGE